MPFWSNITFTSSNNGNRSKSKFRITKKTNERRNEEEGESSVAAVGTSILNSNTANSSGILEAEVSTRDPPPLPRHRPPTPFHDRATVNVVSETTAIDSRHKFLSALSSNNTIITTTTPTTTTTTTSTISRANTFSPVNTSNVIHESVTMHTDKLSSSSSLSSLPSSVSALSSSVLSPAPPPVLLSSPLIQLSSSSSSQTSPITCLDISLDSNNTYMIPSFSSNSSSPLSFSSSSFFYTTKAQSPTKATVGPLIFSYQSVTSSSSSSLFSSSSSSPPSSLSLEFSLDNNDKFFTTTNTIPIPTVTDDSKLLLSSSWPGAKTVQSLHVIPSPLTAITSLTKQQSSSSVVTMTTAVTTLERTKSDEPLITFSKSFIPTTVVTVTLLNNIETNESALSSSSLTSSSASSSATSSSLLLEPFPYSCSLHKFSTGGVNFTIDSGNSALSLTTTVANVAFPSTSSTLANNKSPLPLTISSAAASSSLSSSLPLVEAIATAAKRKPLTVASRVSRMLSSTEISLNDNVVPVNKKKTKKEKKNDAAKHNTNTVTTTTTTITRTNTTTSPLDTNTKAPRPFSPTTATTTIATVIPSVNATHWEE